MDYTKLHNELEEFWKDKLYRVPHKNGKGFYYTYNISKWNSPVSNLLVEIMLDDMINIERRLFLKILLDIKRGYDAIDSGGLFLNYENYSDVCGKTSFYKAKNKFLELKLLLPVKSSKKYFILNPRYVIRMYNPKDK